MNTLLIPQEHRTSEAIRAWCESQGYKVATFDGDIFVADHNLLISEGVSFTKVHDESFTVWFVTKGKFVL